MQLTIEVKNFTQWRNTARQLLRAGVTPDQIRWQHDKQPTLFAPADTTLDELPVVLEAPHISRQFISMASNASHYRDEQRWGLLYHIAWRLVFENRHLLSLPTDKDIKQLQDMCKTIGREVHKMHAFVRFQKINHEKSEQFIAWFEPEHPVLSLACKLFVKRFHTMHWSIFTPDQCAHWNGDALTFSEGATQFPQGHDELESLWLTYYQSIFNPARLKAKAMQTEMPKKYWKNLPEAALIPELIHSAHRRTQDMIDNH